MSRSEINKDRLVSGEAGHENFEDRDLYIMRTKYSVLL